MKRTARAPGTLSHPLINGTCRHDALHPPVDRPDDMTWPPKARAPDADAVGIDLGRSGHRRWRGGSRAPAPRGRSPAAARRRWRRSFCRRRRARPNPAAVNASANESRYISLTAEKPSAITIVGTSRAPPAPPASADCADRRLLGEIQRSAHRVTPLALTDVVSDPRPLALGLHPAGPSVGRRIVSGLWTPGQPPPFERAARRSRAVSCPATRRPTGEAAARPAIPDARAVGAFLAQYER